MSLINHFHPESKPCDLTRADLQCKSSQTSSFGLTVINQLQHIDSTLFIQVPIWNEQNLLEVMNCDRVNLMLQGTITVATRIARQHCAKEILVLQYRDIGSTVTASSPYSTDTYTDNKSLHSSHAQISFYINAFYRLVHTKKKHPMSDSLSQLVPRAALNHTAAVVQEPRCGVH